ncbi:MAG: molybdopterin molybdotransferase MoeA [Ferruginibacter sp.]|nr:molybdopterin molybdotransferase MoeA [Ferruginibacter sp.]
MITVEDAKKLIQEQAGPLIPVTETLTQAAGMVLAADIFSTLDIPAFNQSSMDGYAFSFSGWQTHTTLQIAGEMQAGSNETIAFSSEQAIRIFTGAPVPEGADTVVMQEKVTTENGKLIIQDERLSPGGNVRLQGSEIKSGALALAAGTFLSPAAIGFLAGIGITTVEVYRKPIVSIIVTGKELQQPGNPLQYGQVYESNSVTLTAALRQINIRDVKVSLADDDLVILKTILELVMKESDVVLLTGGISVGDYDFVLEAVSQCGVKKIFHRVKQRPGKPLYFGKKNHQLVFGLPGNPSSVLTCFYEYVLPALQKLSNHTNNGLKILQAPLAKSFQKPEGLTHFLKGFYDGEKVRALDAQESYRLSSFARANCLIKIDEDTTHCDEQENVEIHLLPE